jgi:hypothetical protein
MRTGAAAEFPPVAELSPIGTDPKLDSEHEARRRHDDPQHGDREVADKSLPFVAADEGARRVPPMPAASSAIAW